MKNLLSTWRFFFIHIVECLGGRPGGLDQINLSQLEIGYCLWRGIMTDFADIIFQSLIERLKGKRKDFVPFCGFLSLAFKQALGNDFENNDLEYSSPELMRSLNAFVSGPEDVAMTDSMKYSFIHWARIFKTDATSPVESEGRLGWP